MSPLNIVSPTIPIHSSTTARVKIGKVRLATKNEKDKVAWHLFSTFGFSGHFMNVPSSAREV